MIQGATSINDFPVTTNNQFTYQSIFGSGPVPDYDSYNLGLPIIATKDGFGYDASIVGKVFADTTNTVSFGELPCDGSSYEYNKFSADGIPYSRLGDKLWMPSVNLYRFGTGPGHFGARISVNETGIRITNNDSGPVVAIADGPVGQNTGFYFKPIYTGTTGYAVRAFMVDTNTFWVLSWYPGILSAPSAGNSGFTVGPVDYGENTPLTKYLISVHVPAFRQLAIIFLFIAH